MDVQPIAVMKSRRLLILLAMYQVVMVQFEISLNIFLKNLENGTLLLVAYTDSQIRIYIYIKFACEFIIIISLG